MGIYMLAILCEKDLGDEFMKNIIKIIENLCVMFQIVDDILNVDNYEFSKGKGFLGEDIHEGKITLMVIHALKNLEATDCDRLKEILAMRPSDQKLIEEAIYL